MTPLEECRAQMETLRTRQKEYKEQLAQESDDRVRTALLGKIAALRAALEDLQVQLDHLDPPVRRKRMAQRQKVDTGGTTFDSLGVWSDIEGHSWEQVEAGDIEETNASMVHTWLAEGASHLTNLQRKYLDSYYNQGLSMALIAQQYGVQKSTVSRGIHRGLTHLQRWVAEKRLIAGCQDEQGDFDLERYLQQSAALTGRQRQLALLSLSGATRSQRELAAKLGLNKSTISRTLGRAANHLRQLNVPMAGRSAGERDNRGVKLC